MKQEANSSLIFRHWLKANYKKFDSCTFEMKDTRGSNTFSLRELKEEQRNHALACKGDKGNLMRTVGTTGIADYIFMRNAYAYIVIRYPKIMAIIDIDDFLHETKGITSDRAEEIAIEVIQL
jgi:penicillin-binding protein-related factor A (putative recombinase)